MADKIGWIGIEKRNGNTDIWEELGVFNPYEILANYKQKCKYYLKRMEHAELPKEIMMM